MPSSGEANVGGRHGRRSTFSLVRFREDLVKDPCYLNPIESIYYLYRFPQHGDDRAHLRNRSFLFSK